LLLALVGEKEIRVSDFRAELERLDPSLRSKYRKDRMALLNRMVEEELIYQNALKSDVAGTPEAKRRLRRVEEDAAIKRLVHRDIYSQATVTREEIGERYRQELARPKESSLVKSILYIFTLPEDRTAELIRRIEQEVREGLSFPQIARENSIQHESYEFDSAAFSDLPGQIRSKAFAMDNRTGSAADLGGTILHLFKDAELLDAELVSPCARRIRQALLYEKRERALRKWLSSRQANSTIRLYENALEDMTRMDAPVAEVNGAPLTVADVAALLEGLSSDQRQKKLADKKALLKEAVNREILRQEAFQRKLQEEVVVKRNIARETRRLLVDLAIDRNVTGHTPAARKESLAAWVATLEKAAGVKRFAENVKKMYIPASKDMQDIFGDQAI
jgi:hypothetical protein